MSDTPDPKGPPNCPRLIFNSDGDSTTYIAFEPPITPEQACRDIEEVAGTSVEVFTNSMGRGDETFSHPTGFGEIYGSNVTEWPQGRGPGIHALDGRQHPGTARPGGNIIGAVGGAGARAGNAVLARPAYERHPRGRHRTLERPAEHLQERASCTC